MHKSIALSKIDDNCSAAFLDPVLGVKTHKMALKLTTEVIPRPIHRCIASTHHAMYEAAVSKDSKITFVLCNYLPHHELYHSIMVVSKCFIPKLTILFECGGQHFPIDQDLIITGTLHCLLYVNIFKNLIIFNFHYRC